MQPDLVGYFSMAPGGEVYQFVFLQRDINRYIFVYRADGRGSVPQPVQVYGKKMQGLGFEPLRVDRRYLSAKRKSMLVPSFSEIRNT